MKKLFQLLIVLSSLIFFVDNVKAEEYSYDISDDLIPVFENYTFNTWSTASESSNYNQFKTQIDNVLNKKTSIECVNEIVDNYSNYIFIYGNGNNKAIFWNGNDYEARFGGGYGSYWSMGKQVNGTKIGLYNFISTGNEKVIYLPSDGNYVCSNEYYWTDKQATNTTSLLSYTLQGSNVPNDIINNYNNGYFPTIYTNQDIKVGNYYDGKTTGDFNVSVSYVYDSFTLNGKTYNVDDVIIPRNDTVIPKITFSVSENKETINGEEIVTSKDITIDFGEIDNTKYLYLVSLDGGENWQTYTLTQSTSTTINVKDNCTVIAQILKLSDSSYVTSATQTITGIEQSIQLSINIEKISNSNCIANYKNQKVEVCNDLNITFNYINYDKYIYQLSIDGGTNFIDINADDIKNNIYNYILYDESLIVRILKKTDNAYIISSNYTFSKYNEKPEDPFINFSIFYNFTSCDSTNIICDNLELISPEKYQEIKNDELINIKNVSATLAIQVFNYNADYHYYYSDNLNLYEDYEINTFKKSEYGYYYYTAIETTENMTIIIDIYNSENIYINSYTYTITQIQQDKITNIDNIFDMFSNLSDINENIRDLFNSIWESLKSSKILNYFLILIIGSCFILIISGTNR